MYPGTDYPTHSNVMPDFSSLRESVQEATYAGDQLNTVVSWALSDDDEPFFGVLVFMPRLSETIWWWTEVYDLDEVHGWIDEFLIPCVIAWFGAQFRSAVNRGGMYSVPQVRSILKARSKMIRQRGNESGVSGDVRKAHMQIAALVDQFADRFPREGARG